MTADGERAGLVLEERERLPDRTAKYRSQQIRTGIA